MQAPKDIEQWNLSHLRNLDPIISDSEIVAFGEAVHTSDGFYRAKVKCFQYLIEHHGFRMVAFESPWGPAQATGHFVSGKHNSSHEALQGLFRVWRATSVFDFLNWLRKWNGQHPDDPVQFVGFDTQQPSFDYQQITGFLKKSTPASVNRFQHAVESVYGDSLEQDGNFLSTPFAKSIKSGQRQKPHEDRLQLNEVLKDLTKKFAAQLELPLMSFQAFTDYFFDWNIGCQTGNTELTKQAYSARDESMSKVLQLYHKSSARPVLVWAHNWHILKSDGPNPHHVGGLGSFCSQKWGPKYRGIALSAAKIDIHWPWVEWMQAPQMSENSYERILCGKDANSSWFLDAHNLPGWLPQSSEVSGDIEFGKLSEVFDGLIHLPESPAIEYALGPMRFP